MNRYIEQHIRFQERRFTKRGRGIQIVTFPVLFIGFLFAPGWWTHRQASMPMGLDETTGWCLGVLITALGGALYLWTIALFAKAQGTQVPVVPTQRLVTTGPYAVSRYWPSFEIVRWLGVHYTRPEAPVFGAEDGNTRHVSTWLVDMIVELFIQHHSAAA